MKFPASIQKLIELFAQLPTVGPKTAERYVFYLLKQSPAKLQELADSIIALPQQITTCQQCLAITASNPCYICADQQRKNGQICIVADTRDMLAIEETGQFYGLYHVLGTVINTINNATPDELKLDKLIERIEQASIKEIIIALDPDLAGETTSLYLTKLLKQYNLDLIITRIAKGLPTGASVEYADQTTLGNALKFRNKIE